MNIPPGIKCLPRLSQERNKTNIYKWYTLFFTFFIYCSYHLSRKPISIVKSVLNARNCSELIVPGIPPNETTAPPFINGTNETGCGWHPFDSADGKTLLGSLDIAFLFPYAIGMFVSGHIAERVSLRYFLSAGMLLSGASTVLFGLAYYWNIHSMSYFLAMQVIGGFVQSTGWPSVITCVANWFGKGKRGLIMGVWNSHTSFGNILGSVIAGAFAEDRWGLSFIVPGAIISFLAILVFFFLVPHPDDVGCSKPDQEAPPAINRQYDLSDNEVNDDLGNIQQREESPLLESDTETVTPSSNAEAITFCNALKIPGVVEFSLSLFFAKLVSYVFLFWLPEIIHTTTDFGAELSADLSTVFDFGGITGGILAGVISDFTIGRGTTCSLMLLLAAPMLYVYYLFGAYNLATNVALLFICGFLVNGPYSLITTAVSADLGSHQSLHGNSKALATVTAIIDGTGSLGAALGPLMAGLISNNSWENVFIMIISADIIAMMLLMRVVSKELEPCWRRVCCPNPAESTELPSSET